MFILSVSSRLFCRFKQPPVNAFLRKNKECFSLVYVRHAFIFFILFKLHSHFKYLPTIPVIMQISCCVSYNPDVLTIDKEKKNVCKETAGYDRSTACFIFTSVTQVTSSSFFLYRIFQKCVSCKVQINASIWYTGQKEMHQNKTFSREKGNMTGICSFYRGATWLAFFFHFLRNINRFPSCQFSRLSETLRNIFISFFIIP